MIKIDIISGFLGAGKTTLIKKLLADTYVGEKLAIIENEFGEVGIDTGFLKGSGVEITELSSGCICCSIVGDFEASLKEVADTYKPERIIIEPSGVGKLSDVSRAVKAVEGLIDGKLNSNITVVDVTKCKMYMKNFGEFFIDQVKSANVIVLSRMDKASDKKIKEAIMLIKVMNPNAILVTTPISEISGELMLETIDNNTNLEKILMSELKETHGHEHHHHEHEHHEHHEHHHHHDHDHEHHHHHEHGEDCACGCGGHHAEEIFQSIGLHTTKAFTAEKITEILTKLSDEETFGAILRAKGMVQGENSEWIHFDYVPEEIDVRQGEAQVSGMICVIGSNINEEQLRELFEI